MNTGKIVQVSGPVVDVEFENDDLPAIRDALEVMNGDKKCVMEVAQHIGNHIVRCIMLAASEGLCRDMEVVATGSGIKVPVGEDTLGRLFNVLGQTIDGDKQPEGEANWEIHREPPTFEEQNPAEQMLVRLYLFRNLSEISQLSTADIQYLPVLVSVPVRVMIFGQK